MLDPKDFRKLIIRPTLEYLGLHSDAAELLLLGTALVESDLRWLKQRGGGPALGLFQIEPATHDDVWKTYLERTKSKSILRIKILWLMSRSPRQEQLVSNLTYATAIARVLYWRKTEALPKANNAVGLAKYWKKHYNTHLGAGKEEDFVKKLTPHL